MSDPDYLLDTDTVVGLLRDRPLPVRVRFRAAMDGGSLLAISSVVLFELSFGIARSAKPTENRDRLSALLAAGVAVLSLAESDARAAAVVRAELAMIGTPISPYDLLIAGQARARDTVLVTGNTGEFGRVRGLRIEDWRDPI